MQLSSRQEKLLSMLLLSDSYVHTSNLADQLQISKRTVQREFPCLEDFLKDFDLAFDTKTGKGVRISGDPIKKKMLSNTLNVRDQLEAYTPEERMKCLILDLLKDEGLEKLSYYSGKFLVSEATISHDLNDTEHWLNRCELKLLRQTGRGVTLQGSELAYRNGVQRFLQQYASKNEWDQLIKPEIILAVQQCLDGIHNSVIGQFTGEAKQMFLMQLALLVKRTKEGRNMTSEVPMEEEWKVSEEYDLARKIGMCLSEKFQINLPEQEYQYILVLLHGAKQEGPGDEIDWKLENELLDIVDQMIDVYGAEYAMQMKCDEDFIRGIITHLRPAIVRMQHHLNIYNPLLENIRREYGAAYEKTLKASEILGQAIGVEVPADEVGYLTLHFESAVLKNQKGQSQKRVANIGVICSSGIGLARLMQNKLKNSLGRDVRLTVYAKEDLTPHTIKQQDFFVSSMGLDDLGVDYVKVSPLITHQDLTVIQSKIEEYAREREQSEETDFAKQMDTINEVSMTIRNLLRNFQVSKIQEDQSLQEILYTLSEHVGKTMLEVEEIQHDLMNRERLFTQIYDSAEFALMHCRTKGVDEPLFEVFVPKQGTCFTHLTMKKVRAVVLMLVPRDENLPSNTEMMGSISTGLIERERFMNAVLFGKEQEIKRELERILKDYFRGYLEI